MRSKPIVVLSLLIVLVVGCIEAPSMSTAKAREELIVFAGISLTEPFQDIGNAFNATNESIEVQFNFAIGQQHLQQIANGGYVDVLATASERQMQDAIEAGYVANGEAQIFAQNRLVVVMPPDNPADLHTLQDLANPGVRIVIGAPETAIGVS